VVGVEVDNAVVAEDVVKVEVSMEAEIGIDKEVMTHHVYMTFRTYHYDHNSMCGSTRYNGRQTYDTRSWNSGKMWSMSSSQQSDNVDSSKNGYRHFSIARSGSCGRIT
jgi:hypothetical protein